jgi:hypothetical protein
MALSVHAARYPRLGLHAVPVLVNGNIRGEPRKLVVFPNRNGFYYVLDRTNGKFFVGKPFAKQTWAKGLDDSGRPIRIPQYPPPRPSLEAWREPRGSGPSRRRRRPGKAVTQNG